MSYELAISNTMFNPVTQNFFKPVKSNVLENLFLRYDLIKGKINKMHEFINLDTNSTALNYLMKDGHEQAKSRFTFGVSSVEKAVKYLDSDFWSLALKETDVMEFMPEDRRKQWREQLENHKDLPAFEKDIVINTLKDLLLSRDKFLAEKVDGVFKNLSKTHLTNSPEGFNKKMIIYCGYDMQGYINDLRTVIAKFLNIPEPTHLNTGKVIDFCKNDYGKWCKVDGGAIRMKVYQKGTAHIEIHPDLAWRLNEILSILYPQAIPSEFRKKPTKKYKEFDFNMKIIPTTVLDLFSEFELALDYENGDRYRGYKRFKDVYTFRYSYNKDKHTIQRAEEIITAIGGTKTKRGSYNYKFDYNPLENVIPEIVRSGLIPDEKSFQYYPTNTELAQELITLANIKDGDKCLEPSAGQGGIAKLMPVGTTLVEFSELHCTILKEYGLTNVVNEDFTKWCIETTERFDKIVMNPPFSQGRAEQHVTLAASLLELEGTLVAIVPESMKNKARLDGFTYEWFTVSEGEFKGVSQPMTILKLERKEFK